MILQKINEEFVVTMLKRILILALFLPWIWWAFRTVYWWHACCDVSEWSQIRWAHVNGVIEATMLCILNTFQVVIVLALNENNSSFLTWSHGYLHHTSRLLYLSWFRLIPFQQSSLLASQLSERINKKFTKNVQCKTVTIFWNVLAAKQWYNACTIVQIQVETHPM